MENKRLLKMDNHTKGELDEIAIMVEGISLMLFLTQTYLYEDSEASSTVIYTAEKLAYRISRELEQINDTAEVVYTENQEE